MQLAVRVKAAKSLTARQWAAWALAVVAALAFVFGMVVANTWMVAGDPVCDPTHPAYPQESYASEPCGWIGAFTPALSWSTTQRSVAVVGPVAFLAVAGAGIWYLERPRT